jgi:hypothetical protein
VPDPDFPFLIAAFDTDDVDGGEPKLGPGCRKLLKGECLLLLLAIAALVIW